MTRVDQLRIAVARQLDAVGASAPQDLAKIRAAARVVPDLVTELGLGSFVDALVADHKPRLLLRFRADSQGPLAEFGGEAVLKVYPDQPRGEGALLAEWRSRGLDVPRVRFGERSGCSWLLMEYIQLAPLTPRSDIEYRDLTEELAARGPAMHRPAPWLNSMLRPLDTVMQPRWDAAATALRKAGHEIVTTWRAQTLAAYQSGAPSPLHGDLGLPNIGRDPAGHLVVYDASALLGSSAFDAARWAARTASRSVAPEEIQRRWLQVEGLPATALSRSLLGAECVLEAGAREIIAARRTPSASSPGAEIIPRLLDVARRLLR